MQNLEGWAAPKFFFANFGKEVCALLIFNITFAPRSLNNPIW